MEKGCKHNFTDTKKTSPSTGEWIVIYCKNCGVVSFDQTKDDLNGEYQKILTKPILLN